MTTLWQPTGDLNLQISSTAVFHQGSAFIVFQLTEARTQVTWRQAGTFSGLFTTIQATNNIPNPSTLKSRIGGVNGNQTVTIPSSTTGDFTDSTNSDSISVGNQLNYRLAAGGGGGLLNIAIATQNFAPTTTSNTPNRLVCDSLGVSDNATLTTYYFSPMGQLSVGGSSTTEANAQFKSKITATLTNLYVYITSNTVAIATLTSRIGGSNGNLSISIGSGVTGILEDTSNSDSISSGNLFNTALNVTATAGLTIPTIAMDLTSTDGTTHYMNASAGGSSTTSTAANFYVGFVGGLGLQGTETRVQHKVQVAFTASNMEMYMITNGNTASATFRFRKSAGNLNQNVVYAAGTTGYAEDTTNSDSLSVSDPVNYLVPQSTTAGMVIGTIGMKAAYPVVAATGYYNFFIQM
jgi:hypothetical protein